MLNTIAPTLSRPIQLYFGFFVRLAPGLPGPVRALSQIAYTPIPNTSQRVLQAFGNAMCAGKKKGWHPRANPSVRT